MPMSKPCTNGRWGYPVNEDFNGATQDGVGYHQTTTRNGKRCSTAVAYLHPAMKRPNLQVVMGAMTERVIFEGKRAVGVAFTQNGVRREVRARREVILSGGAVGSPQMLMLSGVGPQEHLQDKGVDVLHHLPGVGQALQDHYSASIKLKCTETAAPHTEDQPPMRKMIDGRHLLRQLQRVA